MTDIAALQAERDTALIQRDALASSFHLANFAAANLRAELDAARSLLREAGRQFRFYEQQHLAKGPDGAAKAKVNGDFAARIEAQLGRVTRTQGEAEAPARREPFKAWGEGDDGFSSDTGAPTADNAGYSMLTWHVCQRRHAIPLTEVAAAFNVSPEMVREAAGNGFHLWVGTQDGVEVVMEDGA